MKARHEQLQLQMMELRGGMRVSEWVRDVHAARIEAWAAVRWSAWLRADAAEACELWKQHTRKTL
jgi:hypothetical protein